MRVARNLELIFIQNVFLLILAVILLIAFVVDCRKLFLQRFCLPPCRIAAGVIFALLIPYAVIFLVLPLSPGFRWTEWGWGMTLICIIWNILVFAILSDRLVARRNDVKIFGWRRIIFVFFLCLPVFFFCLPGTDGHGLWYWGFLFAVLLFSSLLVGLGKKGKTFSAGKIYLWCFITLMLVILPLQIIREAWYVNRDTAISPPSLSSSESALVHRGYERLKMQILKAVDELPKQKE